MKTTITKVVSAFCSMCAIMTFSFSLGSYNHNAVDGEQFFWMLLTSMLIFLCSVLLYMYAMCKNDNEDLAKFNADLVDMIVNGDEAETTIIPEEEFKFTWKGE